MMLMFQALPAAQHSLLSANKQEVYAAALSCLL
jgi:hypothetical protein